MNGFIYSKYIYIFKTIQLLNVSVILYNSGLKHAATQTQTANSRKNEDFKRNIVPIGLFSQKHWILTEKKSPFFNAGCGTLLLASRCPRDTLSLRPLLYNIKVSLYWRLFLQSFDQKKDFEYLSRLPPFEHVHKGRRKVLDCR